MLNTRLPLRVRIGQLLCKNLQIQQSRPVLTIRLLELFRLGITKEGIQKYLTEKESQELHQNLVADILPDGLMDLFLASARLEIIRTPLISLRTKSPLTLLVDTFLNKNQLVGPTDHSPHLVNLARIFIGQKID